MVVCHRLQALSNLITLAWDKSSFSDSAERHQFSWRVLHHRMIADSSVLPQYSTSSASRSNSTSYDFFSGRAEPSEKMFPLTTKWDGNEDPFLRLYRANSHFIDPYVLTRLCLHWRREKKKDNNSLEDILSDSPKVGRSSPSVLFAQTVWHL